MGTFGKARATKKIGGKVCEVTEADFATETEGFFIIATAVAAGMGNVSDAKLGEVMQSADPVAMVVSAMRLSDVAGAVSRALEQLSGPRLKRIMEILAINTTWDGKPFSDVDDLIGIALGIEVLTFAAQTRFRQAFSGLFAGRGPAEATA